MRLEGPYGVGRIQWGRLPVTVLVAGGIGNPPGISIASHLIKKAASSSSGYQAVSHVHLLWIVKDNRHIQWSQEGLRELHAISLREEVPATLDVTIHTTASSASTPDTLSREESYEMRTLKPAEHPWTINTGRPNVAAWLVQIKRARAGLDAAGGNLRERDIYVEEEVFEL
ncbi:Dual oxidase [Tolypocladium ophioglossoides CBS 100239]|uniref:Dual oxidase n=1 Tax=Tolypocladium ophioglossoides (strain CBS 100239) TaxID=1163406 RepID=A0A0L0NJT8_TOLOC|nr:Dual oxidase [Tolypocladium ophioglossoides CBS 100239]